MLAFVIVLQVVVALFLIGVVLLQPGNRGGASAAMGGAGSDTVFGARGANTFLSKITFGAAVCFMVTNFALSFMSTHTEKSKISSVLEQENASPAATTEPAATPPAAAEPAAEEDKPSELPAAEQPAEPQAEPAAPSEQATDTAK